jgi:hypothetical protein
MSRMPMSSFDDPALRSAMKGYLDVADRLDELASVGGEARDLLDLAESKAIAGMALRKRLSDAGWTAPVSAATAQRVTL